MTKILKQHELIYYGLPALPLAMLGLPLFVYLPTFYSQSMGLSLSAVGIALLAARLLDVVTDPLVGVINDRIKPWKHGWQRKSFMVAGMPLLLLGLHFLLKPEQGVSASYLFGWSVITYLGWTLMVVPWLAWGAEISPHYHEKSALAASREFFSIVGTVLVISLPVLLSIQDDLSQTLRVLAHVISGLLVLLVLPLFWKLSDQPYIKRQVTQAQPKQPIVNWQQLYRIVTYPAIKRLLPAYFINNIANALPATLFLLFVSHVLQIPEQAGILLMSYFFAAIVGLPLWLYVSRKTDKHRSWCLALLLSIVSFIAVPFLAAADFSAFLIICLLSGFALGADIVLPASIQADIAQKLNTTSANSTDEHMPQASTGLLFGLWGLLTKLALALAVGIAFPVLDNMGLYTEQSDQQGNHTLIILYAIVPIMLKIWVVWRMWQYPFTQHYFTTAVTSRLEHQSPVHTNVKGEEHERFNKTTHCDAVSITSHKRMQ